MVELKRRAATRQTSSRGRSTCSTTTPSLVCFQRAPLERGALAAPGDPHRAARRLRRLDPRAPRRAWAAGFQNERVTRRGLATAQRLGLETTVYTVNDESRMLQLAALGVSGIFTDRPDRALARPGLSSGRLSRLAPSAGTRAFTRAPTGSAAAARSTCRRSARLRSPSPASPGRGTSARSPRRRAMLSPVSPPFVDASSSSVSGRISTSTRSPFAARAPRRPAGAAPRTPPRRWRRRAPWPRAGSSCR